MEYRRLGRSGLDVSALGLGTNNFGRRLPDPKIATQIVHAAIDVGVNFLDTSNDYGGPHVAEGFIGDALKGRRQQMLIMTKMGSSMGDGPNSAGSGRTHLTQQLDGSLSALGTDYLDVLMVHRPDARTPVEETLRVLDDFVRQGKVRYLGTSNFAAWEMTEAAWVSKTEHLERFVCVEPEYNMLKRNVETELSPFCERYGVGMTPFYPLAGGFLTGKYQRGADAPEGTRLAIAPNQGKRWLTDSYFDTLDGIAAFCERTGHAMIDVAFAWLLAHPVVSSVIAGASKPEQVIQNATSADLRLTAAEMAELDTILEPPPTVAGALAQARESLSAHNRPGATPR
jgi:aryl-alcohol dehydrogenase-like predicted oxidoreductase